MKKIKDYLHFYPLIPIVIIEKSISTEGEIIMTAHNLEGIDWSLDKPIAERVSWDWEEIKPILRPMSDFNSEDFKHIAKIILNTNEIIFAETNGMWLACSNEKPEKEELEMNEVERIYFAEECNYDNVISMDIKGERDFALGCSDDFRFFIGMEKQAIIFQELLSMHFDVFGLIKEGIAFDKNNLPVVVWP